MVQLSQAWRGRSADASWLSMLVETFEQVGRADLRAVACDPPVLAALMVQLARPVSPRGGLLH